MMLATCSYRLIQKKSVTINVDRNLVRVKVVWLLYTEIFMDLPPVLNDGEPYFQISFATLDSTCLDLTVTCG